MKTPSIRSTFAAVIAVPLTFTPSHALIVTDDARYNAQDLITQDDGIILTRRYDPGFSLETGNNYTAPPKHENEPEVEPEAEAEYYDDPAIVVIPLPGRDAVYIANEGTHYCQNRMFLEHNYVEQDPSFEDVKVCWNSIGTNPEFRLADEGDYMRSIRILTTAFGPDDLGEALPAEIYFQDMDEDTKSFYTAIAGAAYIEDAQVVQITGGLSTFTTATVGYNEYGQPIGFVLGYDFSAACDETLQCTGTMSHQMDYSNIHERNYFGRGPGSENYFDMDVITEQTDEGMAIMWLEASPAYPH